ncbi:hypothetical protein TWF694_000637 [Orbilia ellipsospora]|uniref:Uncharacterized protein n=1 Tax=Orbilia ellipsospora TaxID=2528407 RepID=A0AAV9XPJ8_9PEZI
MIAPRRSVFQSCMLACIAIFLFVTLLSFFETGSHTDAAQRTDGLFHEDPNSDDSLHGAIGQKPGESIPGPYQVADPPQNKDQPQQQQPQGQPQQPPAQDQQNPPPQGQEEPKDKPNPEDPEEKKKQGPVPIPKPQWTFEVNDDVYFDPAGPKPEQVVLLMASDGKGHNGGIKGLLDMATQNRQEYADFHGYKFHFINISRYDLHGAHPVWAKIPALLDTFIQFPDAHWVWWLDTDAMIMNPEIDLNTHLLSHTAMRSKLLAGEEFLKGGTKHTGHYMSKNADPKNIDILISQDHNGLNAGSFFLRRSKFTQMLMDFWEEPFYVYNGWPGKEQDALLHMVQHHRQVRERTGLIPQRTLNGYPVGWESMGWFKGDLVLHLAGCWVDHACNERWKDGWDKRITVEDLKAKGITSPTDHTGMVTKITKEGTVYVHFEDRTT